MSQINVYVEKCNENVKLPQYAKKGDSGMDVCSTIDIEIHPNETVIIPIGIKVAIPDGYEIQARPRSGLSYKTPLRISNAPGTIDSGFRDEVGIIFTNTSQKDEGIFNLESIGNKQGTYKINKGDRIAQIVLQAVPKINFIVIDDVTKIGTNRNGGFGSTGVGVMG